MKSCLQVTLSRRFSTLAGYAGRGVVTTATYPARDFGVHSGMGLMKAAALAPAAVLLPVDFDLTAPIRAASRPLWQKWRR